MIRNKTVRRNIQYKVINVKRMMIRWINQKAIKEKEREVLKKLINKVLKEIISE